MSQFWGKLSTLGGHVLRKSRGRLEGFGRFGLHTSSSVTAVTQSAPMRWSFSMFVMLVLALIGLSVLVGDHVTTNAALPAMMLTSAVAPKKSGTEERRPAKIRQMEADLKALAKELEAGQVEMAAGPVTQERGEELETKAAEMLELQGHLDRYNKIAGIVNDARKVDKVTLPREEDTKRKVIWTTPGHLFAMSQELKDFRTHKPNWSGKVEVGRINSKRLVRLTGDAAVEFEKKAFDAATLSDLGTNAIIETDRDRELVRFEEPEILTMRDVFTVTTTTSDSIRYVQHTSTTRGAKGVAKSDPKPYLKIAFTPKDTSVKTIPVLSKVTEQDVADAPRLVGYINGEMSLDIRVEEERQLMWADGLSDDLVGLFDASNNIPEFNRAGVGDTLIDTIRRMRTDRRKARLLPNFAAIDPEDWEQIELEKGSDLRYVWGLITDLRGPRIWSMRVIESDAMTNLLTGERRLLIGDGIRGATIYDRESLTLAVGFVDDDFARNLRTLRAEERLAFAVKRPFAFEYVVTAEGTS